MLTAIDKISIIIEPQHDNNAEKIVEQFNTIFNEISEGTHDPAIIDHIKHYGRKRSFIVHLDLEEGVYIPSDHKLLQNMAKRIHSKKTIATEYLLRLCTLGSKGFVYLDLDNDSISNRGYFYIQWVFNIIQLKWLWSMCKRNVQ